MNFQNKITASVFNQEVIYFNNQKKAVILIIIYHVKHSIYFSMKEYFTQAHIFYNNHFYNNHRFYNTFTPATYFPITLRSSER